MLNGFRDFILRGNVVDLAVGVVMGAAFGSVVTAFTKAFLDPLVKLMTGGEVAGQIVLRAGDAARKIDPIMLDYGSFITSLINFLLTALVIYFFVVKPVGAMMNRFKKEEKPAVAEPSNEEKLLAEIRDAIKTRAL